MVVGEAVQAAASAAGVLGDRRHPLDETKLDEPVD